PAAAKTTGPRLKGAVLVRLPVLAGSAGLPEAVTLWPEPTQFQVIVPPLARSTVAGSKKLFWTLTVADMTGVPVGWGGVLLVPVTLLPPHAASTRREAATGVKVVVRIGASGGSRNVSQPRRFNPGGQHPPASPPAPATRLPRGMEV